MLEISEGKSKLNFFCIHSKKVVPMRDKRLEPTSLKFMKGHLKTCKYCLETSDRVRRAFLQISKNIPSMDMDPAMAEGVGLEIKEVTQAIFRQREILPKSRRLFQLAKTVTSHPYFREALKYLAVSLITLMAVKLYS